MLETAVRSPRSPAPRRPGRRTRLVILAAGALITAFLLPVSTSGAADAPVLGTADSFAVLGHTTVTNTGPTVINGDLGVSPGTAITGFPPGLVNGQTHNNDAVAAQAGIDAEAAYGNLAGQPCPGGNNLTGQDLGGLTLVPGVYCFTSSAQLTGALTLDAQGVGGAVFVFQIGSTLTTASNSSVLFINGANPCNVFWQVGSSATLGTGTDFAGTTIARASIGATTGADVTGRLLALDGAVTLDTNVVSATSCVTGGGTTTTTTTPSTTTTTTPSTTTTTTASTTTTVGAATDAGTDGGTTGGTSGGTTGGATTGGATTGGGTPRTDLPATGNDGIGLSLFGAIAVALGAIATGSSGAWRRSHQPKHLKG